MHHMIVCYAGMWYFAYGSNCDPQALSGFLRSHRVDPAEVTDARRAVLHDYRLRTNYRSLLKWGAANLEPCLGAKTEGVLMWISPGVHEVLRRKEGWPRRYREIYVVVRVTS